MSTSMSCSGNVQSPADSNLDLSRLPDWMVLRESVVLRQSNYSGIIAFIGATEFASGLWVGLELDAPLGTYSKQDKYRQMHVNTCVLGSIHATCSKRCIDTEIC